MSEQPLSAPSRPFRSLAISLIRKVFLLSTICAVVMCAVQAALTYQIVQDRQKAALRDIVASHVPLLALNVWDIEPDALAQQVHSISERPEVGYVWVETKTGQRFFAGDSSLARARALSVNIPYPRLETGSVGSLYIVPNPRVLPREILWSLLPVLLGYGLLTLMLCLFIAGLLRRELQRPLEGVARFVGELNPRNLTMPLQLQRPHNRHRDEIDLVVEGFGTLQRGISEHIENLDRLVAERTQDLENALSSLQRIAMTDPLTGCFNRRHFDERFPMEVERAQRYARPLSVMFCDVDHFKQINDSYGHAFGDEVLRGFASHLLHHVRSEVDWVARYGGEEFIIVLPETALQAACATAERLRRRVEAASFSDGLQQVQVTASFGVAEWLPGDNPERLLARADALLLEAKQTGRNRVLPLPLSEDALRAASAS